MTAGFEGTILAWAGLLAAAQLLLMAVPANLQMGSDWLAGPRDTAPPRELTGAPARLKRAFENHVEGLVMFAAAVAAVVVFVVFGPLTEPGDDGTPRLRGTGSSITPLAPEGEFDHFPRRFTWSTTTDEPGTTYRWELYDAQARRRATEVVADTLLVRAPESTPADSTGRWRWIVVEIAPDGAEGGTSASTSFEVVPPR